VLLPGMDGIAATRQILAANPGVIVILVSTRRRSELPASIEHCGAVGFLQKEAVDPDALGALIR
jgi:two-component system, NarL family, invasion response regulator UvrY